MSMNGRERRGIKYWVGEKLVSSPWLSESPRPCCCLYNHTIHPSSTVQQEQSSRSGRYRGRQSYLDSEENDVKSSTPTWHREWHMTTAVWLPTLE
jgi:hypothetical protein